MAKKVYVRFGYQFNNDIKPFFRILREFVEIVKKTKLDIVINNLYRTQMKKLWEENVREVFAKEGQVANLQRWKPLTKKWLEFKLGIMSSKAFRQAYAIKKITGYKMLVWKDFGIFDGLMRYKYSLTDTIEKDKRNIEVLMSFPNLAHYAVYHQTGAKRAGTKWVLPQRTFIRFSYAFRNGVKDYISKKVKEEFKTTMKGLVE